MILRLICEIQRFSKIDPKLAMFWDTCFRRLIKNTWTPYEGAVYSWPAGELGYGFMVVNLLYSGSKPMGLDYYMDD